LSFVIRPARAEDVPLIASWTRDTFSWGDYVPDALSDWVEDAQSLVIVCVLEDDVPVAVSRTQLLTSIEAWLSGARVHPDHRRSGMGMAMNDFGVEWARHRGALVARLAIEEDNEAARAQVVKSGYRLTGRWLFAKAGPPTGRRMESGLRLRPGATIDADAAWMFWSQSDLARAARDMIPEGWRWRKGTRQELEDAVHGHTFFQGAGGWAIVTNTDHGIGVRWVATAPTEAPLLLEGLRDLLRERKGGMVEMMIPESPWVTEALLREGFEVRPGLVYSKTLS